MTKNNWFAFAQIDLFSPKKIGEQVIFFILMFIVGSLAMELTYRYEVVQDYVSWFFPTGCKIVFLWLLPTRLWLVILIGIKLGHSHSFYFNFGYQQGPYFELLPTYLYYTIYQLPGVAIILWLKHRLQGKDIFKLENILIILLSGIVFRLSYMSFAAYFKSGVYAYLPPMRYFEYFMSHQLSGYLTFFYILTIGLIIVWLHRYRHKLDKRLTIELLCITVGAIIFVNVLHAIQPSVDYLLRIAMFIPLIIIGMRYGWIGVMLTSFCINTGALVYLYDLENEILLVYQPYMLSYLLVGLLLSGVLHNNELFKRRILHSQNELAQKNAELVEMSERMRSMANNIINVQEDQRKTLSQELHDEVGQNLTALKTSLKIFELQQGNTRSQAFSYMNENVNQIYDSVYDLMHWLRPRVLDDLGLYKTLTGYYFESKLGLVGIQYKHDVQQFAFPDNVEIAIFRIVQEAITNTIKHSNASKFWVALSISDAVYLTVTDNGTSTKRSSSSQGAGGFGLEGIKNRVISLDGICELSSEKGFKIQIILPLRCINRAIK